METYMMFLPELLRGAGVTIQVLLLSAAFAFIFAFIAGLGRVSRFWVVRFLMGALVELFRGTSLLVQ
ncbi:ABC transporter permease subunit, partial [Siminovitchia fortis]|uniref:ABC transporter permease subunit n=1 Tax=Siminovitchia fortis TaxID=254758 RepID=UPI001FCFAE1E